MSIKRKYIISLNEIKKIIKINALAEIKCKKILDYLRKNYKHYNWIGIYLLKNKNKLKLFTYSGDKETQHKIIPINKGLCGLAVRKKEIINVPDVTLNSNYLECFPETKSELIVPIFKNNELIGEIDIDSYKLNAFNKNDEWFINKIGEIIVKIVIKK